MYARYYDELVLAFDFPPSVWAALCYDFPKRCMPFSICICHDMSSLPLQLPFCVVGFQFLLLNFSDNCNVLSYIRILTETYGMSSLLLQLRLAKSSKTLFFNNYFLEIRALLETFFSRISFFLRIKSKNLITLFITVLFFYPAIKYFGTCDPN